ncbi:hypothetical protein OH77DRAFT_1392835 [Trametes cingulata]|nr:hypothetical protein OH77DRAFT_1392835 [Trametes cingulata]
MATAAIAPAFQSLLTQSIERAYASLDVRLQDMDALSGRVGVQLMHLEREMELLQHGVHILIGDAEEAGYALATALQDANAAHEKQSHIAQIAHDVEAALDRLVDQTRIEMQSINETAAEMKESLLQGSSDAWGTMTWSWLEAASIHLLKYIWNEDSSFLDVPAFRILLLSFRVLWSVLGFVSSGLMVSPFAALTRTCTSTISQECARPAGLEKNMARQGPRGGSSELPHGTPGRSFVSSEISWLYRDHQVLSL